MSLAGSLNNYYQLIKPGIVRGNAITAAAGFFLASQGNINWSVLAATVGGLSLMIASACVFNNYIDRDIDKKMERTKNRTLVKGTIKPANALVYGAILGLTGLFILAAYTNLLSASIALFGFFSYVVIYTNMKRRSVHGTLIGSVPGAVPPVVGYCAVSGHIDKAAVILFLILVCWQMAHFYSIGIYRAKDYAAAGLPIMPIKHGFEAAQKQIIFYIAAFVGVALLLSAYDYTGYTYAIIVLLIGALWLRLGLQKLKASNSRKWAGKMFGFSILALTILSATLSVSYWLP